LVDSDVATSEMDRETGVMSSALYMALSMGSPSRAHTSASWRCPWKQGLLGEGVEETEVQPAEHLESLSSMIVHVGLEPGADIVHLVIVAET
jgi:hypothetical protein